MIQIVKYKCCGNVFAALRDPEKNANTEWIENLKKYIERGDIVEMIDPRDFKPLKFASCECKTVSGKQIDFLIKKLNIASEALREIAGWNDDLEDEYGDPGICAREALIKIRNLYS